jgi:hypothetical protein
MVGVINANASTSISTQIALARQADFQLLPGEPFPNEKQQASLASLAATATTATLTVTATGAHESNEAYGYGHDHSDDASSNLPTRSCLSNGAIAGIAVGAAIGGIAIAALFFLMCRTRSLKKQLDQQQQQQMAAQQQQPFMGYHDSSRHTSTLPPYPSYTHMSQEMKPEDREAFGSERSQSPMQTPHHLSGHFAPMPLRPDQRYTQ